MRTTVLTLSSIIGISGLLLGCSGAPEPGELDYGHLASGDGFHEGGPGPRSNEDKGEEHGAGVSDSESSSSSLGECHATNVFDAKYGDGHVWKGEATPILPPGKWDWKPSDNDLANWKNFEKNVGMFGLLTDIEDEPFGWELLAIAPNGAEFAGAAAYFEGSAGRDVVNLGPQGKIHSMSGGLGPGPDVLVFNESWSLDFSTSSEDSGDGCDEDVIVAGCDVNAGSAFDIDTTSIHAGSGADLLFVRDAERSGFDMGNLGGVTSELDSKDGDDIAVLRGNMLDFRFFGGSGDDTAIWYVDEVKQNSAWLGPNFFGGGGSGEALWGDAGTDRLVLVIPESTKLIASGATQPGQILVRVLPNYQSQPEWDGPTDADPKARYCVTCGVSPAGAKTITIEYRSADGKINTGYFWVTAFEELQIGLGPGARVYSIDQATGGVTLDPSLAPTDPPALDPAYCAAKG